MYKMNAIVNKFLLAGDEFMPEMHLKQPGFTCLWTIYQKQRTNSKNLNKQEIQNIFTEMNWLMIWLMEILKT